MPLVKIISCRRISYFRNISSFKKSNKKSEKLFPFVKAMVKKALPSPSSLDRWVRGRYLLFKVDMSVKKIVCVSEQKKKKIMSAV